MLNPPKLPTRLPACFSAHVALAGVLVVGIVSGCHVDATEGDALDAAVDEPDAFASGDATPPGLDAGTDAERPTLRILFVGNSYTYVNDVPGILRRIAETAGAGPLIATDQVVKGGASLTGHLSDGIAATRIAEATWTHVVLQQQSQLSGGGLSGVSDPAAQQFAAMIVDAGARPTWFVTWAYAEGDGSYPTMFRNPTVMQDLVTRGYAEEARQVPGSLLACVGEAFRTSLRQHPEIALHQEDKSHASLAGSYLAAATFYVALTGQPVPDGAEVPSGISPTEAGALRESARIGSRCADVKLRADVHLMNMHGAFIHKPYELGFATPPFDFGVAGAPIPATFVVVNDGELGADVEASVTGRYVWTRGGVFPGIGEDAGATAIAPCGGILPPRSQCRLSVMYVPHRTGNETSLGSLGLKLTNAYDEVVAVPLIGRSAPEGRALLVLGTRPLWAVPRDRTVDFGKCGPLANFVVSNRGSAATTSVTARPLAAPFTWGTSGEGFPGGTGAGSPCIDPFDVDPSATLPYCTNVIAPGESCLMGIAMAPQETSTHSLSVGIGYSDALGPAAADATMTISAQPAPPKDGGVDATTD